MQTGMLGDRTRGSDTRKVKRGRHATDVDQAFFGWSTSEPHVNPCRLRQLVAFIRQTAARSA